MSAGKGDTPRPVDAKVYGQNYDNIFRKKDVIRQLADDIIKLHTPDIPWPHDPEPFESQDHDNDEKIYND